MELYLVVMSCKRKKKSIYITEPQVSAVRLAGVGALQWSWAADHSLHSTVSPVQAEGKAVTACGVLC